MTRQLKSWQGCFLTDSTMDARKRDGRHASQVKVAVRASSQKAATEALGYVYRHGVGWFRNYMTETGNPECLAALDQYEPLTVLIRGLHPGDTIDGQTGWVRAWTTKA